MNTELLGKSTLEKLAVGFPDDDLTDWGEPSSELTDWKPCEPTVDLDGVLFWLCAEFYSGSGRLSRTWIEQSAESPDEPTECSPDCPYWNDDRSPWSHDMSHIAYPFNGMGGEVVAGPFNNREQAEQAEFEFELQEQ